MALTDNTAPADTNAGSPAGEAPAANAEFLGSISEDLRGNEALSSIEDVNGLARAFVDTQAQFSELQGKIPQVPATAADYGVDIPEGYNEQAMSEFLELAHSTGLSSDQVNSLLKYQHEKATAKAQAGEAEVQKGLEGLTREWGANFEANAALANSAVNYFGGEALKQYMNDSGRGNNAVEIKAWLKVAQSMSEDTLLTGSTNESKQRPIGVDGRPQLEFPSMKK